MFLSSRPEGVTVAQFSAEILCLWYFDGVTM
jgi:hypothetical protein